METIFINTRTGKYIVVVFYVHHAGECGKSTILKQMKILLQTIYYELFTMNYLFLYLPMNVESQLF